MAVERADLSGSLNIEQTAPLSGAPGAQGQALPKAGDDKPRRRPPPPEEACEEPPGGDNDNGNENDQPPHRIDRLA
jgi:hypothetical protein